MANNKDEIQVQLSELIHKDIVSIITNYSNNSIIDLNLVITLVQDINLLKTYDVKYIHNMELNEIIRLMREELKDVNSARVIALLSCFDYLLNTSIEFKHYIYVNLTLKIFVNNFYEAFSIFNLMASSVKELYSDFIYYIFNDKFLMLNESIQVDCIYKIWSFSQKIFNDNEASRFAYDSLRPLFNKALLFEKTEVAFWLYYTPLHYFHSATESNIDELNEKFKNEIEKPLEQYILNKLVPKYNITPNTKTINKNGKIKVAFVMQRIIRHSTMNVLYSLMKSLMAQKNDKYEFILYDLSFPEAGGSREDFVKEFEDFGIEYRNLHQEILGNTNPTYSLLEKSIKTREILIYDNIDVMIGLHTRVEYIFLYATRTVSKQIYWYHGSNAQYDINNIDYRICHGKLLNSNFEMNFVNIPLNGIKISNNVYEEEKKIRNSFPQNTIFLGTIGRLIKIDNSEYLETIIDILKRNENTIYLACGGGDKNPIIEKIKNIDNLMIDKFIFTGFIEPSIYNSVIDIWPDTFPINQGMSRIEAGLMRCAIVVKLKENDYRQFDENTINNIKNYYNDFDGEALNTTEKYTKFLNELIVNDDFREFWKEWNKNNYTKNYLHSNCTFVNMLAKVIG